MSNRTSPFSYNNNKLELNITVDWHISMTSARLLNLALRRKNYLAGKPDKPDNLFEDACDLAELLDRYDSMVCESKGVEVPNFLIKSVVECCTKLLESMEPNDIRVLLTK